MSAELAAGLTLPSGARLANRLAKSALSEGLGDRHHAPTPDLIRLYRRWSVSGAGLLVTGNVMVDRRALGELGNVAVEDDRHAAQLAEWAAAATAGGGAQAWVQLNHPGRQAPRALNGGRPLAPSRSASPAHRARSARPARSPRPRSTTSCDGSPRRPRSS